MRQKSSINKAATTAADSAMTTRSATPGNVSTGRLNKTANATSTVVTTTPPIVEKGGEENPTDDEVDVGTADTASVDSAKDLETSLLAVANSPTACSACLIKSIPKYNNPAPRRQDASDGAHYWLDDSGNILQLRFLAIVNKQGQYSRFGNYFNLPSDGIDVGVLKKTRAQFELYQLTEHEYPAAAVACSVTGFNGLLLLASRAERNSSAAPNKGYNQVKEPRVQPFHRVYEGADRFTVVANTAPLFENVPDHNAVQNAIIKNSNIDDDDLTTPMSPSKIKAAALKGSSNRSSTVPTPTRIPGVMYLDDLPDPEGRYDGLVKAFSLSGVTVNVPDVRDHDGRIITPGEYVTKIKDGDIVEVEVRPKLWIIKPKASAASNTNDSAGSRIYQLDLKKMKLMPYINYITTNGKGKRKVADDDEERTPHSPYKKPSTRVEGAVCDLAGEGDLMVM